MYVYTNPAVICMMLYILGHISAGALQRAAVPLIMLRILYVHTFGYEFRTTSLGDDSKLVSAYVIWSLRSDITDACISV